jgi:response regulator RpfG family c-di-GMP phosphodiesterase
MRNTEPPKEMLVVDVPDGGGTSRIPTKKGEAMSENKEHRILLVDDEENITRALKRLLRNEGWRIETCNSGPSALALISEADEPFSLIISDQRMPGMSGSEFLEKSAEVMPEAVRFLLTGYSDIQAMEDAVNKGKIKRYLTKPWDDAAILLHIRQAIEEVALRQENERLTRLTRKQNRQLYEIGLTLEKKVRERTQELKKTSADLAAMNRKLENSFFTTVHLLISMIEAGDKILGGYLRQVGRLSKQIACHMGLQGRALEAIEMAGMMHDMSLFGMPAGMLQQSESEMNRSDLRQFRQHPVLAAISMESVENLSDAAKLVRHHHERYDGKGFPGRLKGGQIPLGARIVSVASDYCRIFHYWPNNMQEIIHRARANHGLTMNSAIRGGKDALLQEAARKIIKDGIRQSYDENVALALIEVTGKAGSPSSKQRLQLLPIEHLQPGMVVPQDLFLLDGRMLLAQSTRLDADMVRTIQKMGKMKMVPESISIAH